MTKRKKKSEKATVHDELAKLENGVSGPQLQKLGDLLETRISGDELERLYEGAGFTQLGISAATGISVRAMRNAVYSRVVRKPIELAVRHVLHLVELNGQRRRAQA